MRSAGYSVEIDPEFPADGGPEPERIPPALIRITQDPQHGQVLLLGHTDMTAIGAEGVRWRSSWSTRNAILDHVE